MKKQIYLSILLCIILAASPGCTATTQVAGNPGDGLKQQDIKEYKDGSGWSIEYPLSWNRAEAGFIQEETSGKTIEFQTREFTQAGLESWIDSEIQRKLNAEEASNTLAQPLVTEHNGKLTIYSYTILSKMEGSEHKLRTTVIFDGKRAVEFRGALPPLTEEEYNSIIKSYAM